MIRIAAARHPMYVLLSTGLVMLCGCNQATPLASGPASSASTVPATSLSAASAYTPPSANQLYQLVAPIALFPDNLVAQVLAGSTYPDQIIAADNLLTSHPGVNSSALLALVNPQPWDASVKALTTFPSVLDQMAKNAQWTAALGNAYANDPTDVMNAIQVMRQRAAQRGNLKTNARQSIVTQAASPTETPAYDTQAATYYDGPAVVQPPSQVIEIAPAQPDTVYVPDYDPETVYGQDVPYYPNYSYVHPSYSAGDVIAAGAVTFGAGILIGSLIDHHGGGGYGHGDDQPPGGGWNSWGMRWHGGSGGGAHGGGGGRPAVIHNNNVYVSHSSSVVNRYTTNNINNSVNTNNSVHSINHIENVSNSNNVHGAPTAASALHTVQSQAATRGAMSVPHFGAAPQQVAAAHQQAVAGQAAARGHARPAAAIAQSREAARRQPATRAVTGNAQRAVVRAPAAIQPRATELPHATAPHHAPERSPAAPHAAEHPPVPPPTHAAHSPPATHETPAHPPAEHPPAHPTEKKKKEDGRTG